MSNYSIEQSRNEKIILRQVGSALLLNGCALLLDQTLKTGWMDLSIVFFSSIYFYGLSFVKKQLGLIIVAGLLVGITAGLFLFFNSIIVLPINVRIGSAVTAMGVGFLMIVVGRIYYDRHLWWWSFFICWVIISIGITLLFTERMVLNYVLWVVTGVGTGLLIWGVGGRLLGLIIPGSILSSVGIGIYSAWSNSISPNGLTETGIMLVWFALGWGVIIVFSRVITTRFVWWPLIPGGILAVVGWGLYSGGNPNNALSFIGNTGSIGVLIFGLYLLLMRRGMKS